MLFSTIALLASVGLFQAVVDPHGNLGTGLDTLAPWRSHFGRVAKARQLAEQAFDLVILGTSRSLNGIDPGLEAWGDRRVFNAAVVGTNMFEIERVGSFVLDSHPPRELLIEASLLAFGKRRTTARDFASSAFNPERESLEALLTNIFGWESLRESARLVRKWLRGAPEELVPRTDGLRQRIGDPASTRELFALVLRNFATDPDTYGAFEFGPDRVELLESLIERASAAGIGVTLYTPPVHALQMETLRLLGLQPDMDRMRRELARIADRFGGSGVNYWDFTGFTGPTVEPLPQGGPDPMRWYFDSSHFRPRLGAVVVRRMFGATDGTQDADDGALSMGTRLDLGNVEVHLLRQERDHAAWAADHPEELRWLRGLLDGALP